MYGAPCLWRCALMLGLCSSKSKMRSVKNRQCAEAALTTVPEADTELHMDQEASADPTLVQFSLPAPIVYARPMTSPATLPLMNPMPVYAASPYSLPVSRVLPV